MFESITVESLLESFFQARKPIGNPQLVISQAESMGERQLAKILRAVIASDGYRDRLMRNHLPAKLTRKEDYYVCPHCGLIYEAEPPVTCLADETPGVKFEHIG